MDFFMLYLFTRLDAVSNMGVFAMVVGGVAALMLFIFGQVEVHDDSGPMLRAWAKRAAWLMVLGALVTVAVPTKKDALFILAGIGVLEVAKSQDAKRLASKSVQVIEHFLDKQLKQHAAE